MGMAQDRVDFSTVTEGGSGDKGSLAQLVRAYSRYRFAGEFCSDKDVLEVACGIGQGLGLLAKRAKRVVGLDVDEGNVVRARETYSGRASVELVVGDAEELPFPDRSFDVVILYEAIYYLAHPDRFLREARRVLRPGGVVLVCTANKDLPDFNPGAFTHKYFGPGELAALMDDGGFDVKLFGGGPIRDSRRARAVRALKAVAARLHLIPTSMRGKELLKRMVFGRLVEMPSELSDGLVEYERPEAIPAKPALGHLVVFAVGTRREPGTA